MATKVCVVTTKEYDLEQAIKKLARAAQNAKRFGIIDTNPLNSPDIRECSGGRTDGFIAVIPNTAENREIIREKCSRKNHQIVFFGRGPRKGNRFLNTPGSYPLKFNPPYVGAYQYYK